MKNKALFLIALIFINFPAFAESPVLQNTTPAPKIQTTQTVPQNSSATKSPTVTTNFENCVRSYKTSVDNLFYLTLAAINANNYKIDEIQSRSGYISFWAGNKILLASITSVDNKTSMIRITPIHNSYAFSPILVERIFFYLTNNIK